MPYKIFKLYWLFLWSLSILRVKSIIINCVCSCVEEETVCTSDEGAPECEEACKYQCLIGNHTTDSNGSCINISNCTCIAIETVDYVCAISRNNEERRTFTNLRNMHCYNLCNDNEFEYERHGDCDTDSHEPGKKPPCQSNKTESDEAYMEREGNYDDMFTSTVKNSDSTTMSHKKFKKKKKAKELENDDNEYGDNIQHNIVETTPNFD